MLIMSEMFAELGDDLEIYGIAWRPGVTSA